MRSLPKQVLFGTFWSLIGQFGSMFIALITNIVLARLLTPFEFGQVGIIMFFVILTNVLTEGGMGGALVRTIDISKEDYSTVFVFNFLMSLTCFIILLYFSGPISNFYDDPALQNLIIASSTILIINSFQITQNARLMRELRYKRRSLYRFLSIFFSSVIGIFLAYKGWGVWSLVLIQIMTSAFTTSLLWYYEGIFFTLRFSQTSFNRLYKFGINTTFASLLDTAFDNIYQLIIGRYFSISQVGFYYQAKKLQEVPVGLIKSTTLGVVFSSLSRVQGQKQLFNKIYIKITILFTISLGLLSILLFFYSETIINILYGEKWLESTIYMKLLIIGSYFYMQEMLIRILFKVFDQTHKILYLEVVKKIIMSLTIILGVIFLNIKILLYGLIFSNVVSYILYVILSRKIIGDSTKFKLFLNLKVIIISVLIVFLFSFLLEFLNMEAAWKLLVSPLIIAVYFLLIRISQIANVINEIKEILSLVRK